MSENDDPAGKQQDPAKVWGELDDTTRERVIEMFVDMALQVVLRHSELSLGNIKGRDETKQPIAGVS